MDWTVATLALLGSLFTLVAFVGVLRFDDLLSRAHAASKAGVLGAGLLLIAAAVHFGADGGLRALIAFGILLVTAPVAAQAIAHTARPPSFRGRAEGRAMMEVDSAERCSKHSSHDEPPEAHREPSSEVSR